MYGTRSTISRAFEKLKPVFSEPHDFFTSIGKFSIKIKNNFQKPPQFLKNVTLHPLKPWIWMGFG